MAVGRLKRSQLTEVEPGIYLGTRAARAYRRLKVDFAKRGRHLKIVGRFAAYRDALMQNGMAEASRTKPGSAEREYFDISSTSTVPVAYHPNGTHEDGRCFDFLLDGSSAYPSAAVRRVFAKHGFKFQFGPRDQNHVRHNNVTDILPVTRAWCVKNHLFVQPKK